MTGEMNAVCSDLLPFAPKSERTVSVSASSNWTLPFPRRPRSCGRRRGTRPTCRGALNANVANGCRPVGVTVHVFSWLSPPPSETTCRPSLRTATPATPPTCASTAGPIGVRSATDHTSELTTLVADAEDGAVGRCAHRRPARARSHRPVTGDLVQRVVELVHGSDRATAARTRGPSCSSDWNRESRRPEPVQPDSSPSCHRSIAPSARSTTNASVEPAWYAIARDGLATRDDTGQLTFLLGRGDEGLLGLARMVRGATPRPRGGCRDRDGAAPRRWLPRPGPGRGTPGAGSRPGPVRPARRTHRSRRRS